MSCKSEAQPSLLPSATLSVTNGGREMLRIGGEGVGGAGADAAADTWKSVPRFSFFSFLAPALRWRPLLDPVRHNSKTLKILEILSNES